MSTWLISPKVNRVHDPGGSTLFLQQRCNVTRTVQQEDNNRSDGPRSALDLERGILLPVERRGSTLQKRDTKKALGDKRQEWRFH